MEHKTSIEDVAKRVSFEASMSAAKEKIRNFPDLIEEDELIDQKLQISQS